MENKKLWLGMLVMVLVFEMTVVGCDNGNDYNENPYTPPAQPGDSASNPIDRTADTNLGTMTSSASGWRQLLNSISSTGKYINLDLSSCTMTGTEFNPDPTVETGKNFIVSIILPTVATSIAAGASSNPSFKNFTNLKSVIGANIETIGDYSFSRETGGNYYYSSLQSADFPRATTVGERAFANTWLESITLPQVTTIGERAFYSSSLKNASFPLVQTIGVDAFMFCSSLESISFPASAEPGYSSGSYSNPFTYCEKITFSLTGSGSLSVIENGKALIRNGTTLLAYPSATGNVSMNNITAIDGKAFQGLYYLDDINFPQVITIGSEAFTYCSNLQDATFPQAVTISSGAFSNCSRLQSASFPLATTIGSSAFSYSYNLTSLNIPSVSNIGGSAFLSTEDTALSITMGTTRPTLDSDIFNYITTAKTVRVKVPAGATGYSPFTSSSVTVSGTDDTANWANGFRGGGWNGSTWNTGSQYITGTLRINQNITLIIEQQ